MKAAERRHMDAVAELGCVICGGPAGIHHVRHNASRRDHMRVLPLCGPHHQAGGLGVALHAGVQTWEARHGTQVELLAEVEARLAC